jgi:multiple sugar transport system ATP-binding protein
VRTGEEAELWVDASRLHLFDPEEGRNLTAGKEGPPATGDGQPTARQAPEAAPAEGQAQPDA